MSKLSNIITMTQLLSTGRKYSIKELSEELEVTPRMIRVYKEELDKSGIYIDTIMGPYGGYVLNQSIRIPVRKFKFNDFKILDDYINSESDQAKKNNLINLQDKIRGIYQGSKDENKELNIDSKYNVITKAIKEKRKVRIIYYSYEKGENERVIDPIEMFLFENGWFVAAYCELRHDIRHFELKRVITYELLDEYYE